MLLLGRVRVWDDLYSWLHTLAAAVFAALDPCVAVAASLVFVEYQRYERETWRSKRGDFVEWLAGLLAGTILRLIVWNHMSSFGMELVR